MVLEPSPDQGRRGELRRRLGRVLLGLTFSALLILGVGYWAIESYVEQHSQAEQLQNEIDRRLQAGSPAEPGEPGEMLRYFRPGPDTAMPEALARLLPGLHDDVDFEGRHYRVLVRELAPGQRVYLLNDVGPLATRERQLLILLAASLLFIGFLAHQAASRLAELALAPLERLAGAIRVLDPSRREARLALEQDQELRDIGLAFNEHLAALERMTGRELAFAAAVSHELRTHLAVVENTTELLVFKAPQAETEVRRIARAVRRATEDLDALLATARPQQPPTLVKVNLRALLELATEDMAAGQADAMPAIEWSGEVEAVLETDARTLTIIFSNLLRNAVTATGPQGCIRIHTSANGFTIEDDGPGLPAGDWSRLFEPWFEGRNGGSGLGLFIAYTLSQRLGARLRLGASTLGGLIAIVERS
jgi:signal transduction histidine kinase